MIKSILLTILIDIFIALVYLAIFLILRKWCDKDKKIGTTKQSNIDGPPRLTIEDKVASDLVNEQA